MNCHSDAQGYYVPIDFPVPLMPVVMAQDTGYLWPVGSTQRLRDEVDTLCNLLEVPHDMTVTSKALEQALETPSPKRDAPLWQCQPIATYSAVLLREAAERSLQTGAAIAFN